MQLADMQARVAQPGRVQWIGLRPARRTAMVAVTGAGVDADGLAGDRGRAGKRAVSLIQWEHLATIGAYLGRGPVAPEILRRNIVVAGINLVSLRGRDVRIGGAVLHLGGVCAPCSRMEAALGPGGYAALRGHGGFVAQVVAPGQIALGDIVMPLDAQGG